MRTVPLWITIGLVCLAMIGCSKPAPVGQKTFTFHGKVESVDTKTKNVKVAGEKVDGWMDAMTMDYKVDDPGVLKKVKAGDQIMATVYDGDLVLHQVKVMPASSGDSKGKK